MNAPIRLRAPWEPFTRDVPVVVAARARFDDVQDLRRRVADVRAAVGVPVQCVRADRVLSPLHLSMAFAHAERARRDGRTRADDPALEWLLYLAVDRQIRHAVDGLGVPFGVDSAVAVAALGTVSPQDLEEAMRAAGFQGVGPFDVAETGTDLAWWDARLGLPEGSPASKREARLLAMMALLALDRP